MFAIGEFPLLEQLSLRHFFRPVDADGAEANYKSSKSAMEASLG